MTKGTVILLEEKKRSDITRLMQKAINNVTAFGLMGYRIASRVETRFFTALCVIRTVGARTGSKPIIVGDGFIYTNDMTTLVTEILYAAKIMQFSIQDNVDLPEDIAAYLIKDGS